MLRSTDRFRQAVRCPILMSMRSCLHAAKHPSRGMRIQFRRQGNDSPQLSSGLTGRFVGVSERARTRRRRQPPIACRDEFLRLTFRTR